MLYYMMQCASVKLICLDLFTELFTEDFSYIIYQNKLQLFTLYSMNSLNWLSTLVFMISKAHLKSSMTKKFDSLCDITHHISSRQQGTGEAFNLIQFFHSRLTYVEH